MKQLKKAGDGDTSILYVGLIALGLGLLFATMCNAQTPVTSRQEFLTALSKGDVQLMNDIDLTGEQSLPVTHTIYGNGKTIHYKTLPATGEVFLFMLSGGVISDLTVFGPNGNVMAYGGYFGAVRVLIGGTIDKVNFINCDKFGIYNNGIRHSNEDVCYITNCTFTGIKRNGYGYSVWTQYGYSIIRNSIFQDGRHGIDGSSESNQYDIQYCTFAGSFYNYPIHLHEYGGGKSGAGFVFKHNYVFGKQQPIDIWPPHSGVTDIDSNYFESATIGKIGAKEVPVARNLTHGNGMIPAPIANQTVTYKVGDRIAPIPASGAGLYYPDGKPATSSKIPRVKTFGVYRVEKGVRSITGYYTVSVTDTGKYTGVWIKCYRSSVEVYVNGVLRERVSPVKWSQYLYRGVVTFKVIGEAGGECYIDDFVKSGTSETFEATNKIKVYGYEGTVKTGRFNGESASGLWGFKFGFVSQGSVRVE